MRQITKGRKPLGGSWKNKHAKCWQAAHVSSTSVYITWRGTRASHLHGLYMQYSAARRDPYRLQLMDIYTGRSQGM